MTWVVLKVLTVFEKDRGTSDVFGLKLENNFLNDLAIPFSDLTSQTHLISFLN